MGRIKFKVRDLKFTDIDTTETKKEVNIIDYGIELDNVITENRYEILKNYIQIKQSKKVCRICYCDDREVESPLLNPCNCSGGVKYIHFSCLQQWLKSKCIIKSNTNENCITYTMKLVECEICKSVLPDFVKYQNKLYEIWEFVKPAFKNYVTLETIITDKEKSKNLYILNLDNKSYLKIGRSHEADLRISDISVSRFHAMISRNSDGSITIEDNHSKFGSLISIQNPKIPINYDPSLCLQIGRSLVHFNLKPHFKLFSCFSCRDSPEESFDYTMVNQNFIEIEKVLSVKIQNDEELGECSSSNNSKSKLSKYANEGPCYKENIDKYNNDIVTSNNEKEDEFEDKKHLNLIPEYNIKNNQIDNLNYIYNEHEIPKSHRNSNYKKVPCNFDASSNGLVTINFKPVHVKKRSIYLSPCNKINLTSFKKYEEDQIPIENLNIIEEHNALSDLRLMEIASNIIRPLKTRVRGKPIALSEASSVKETERMGNN
jgi:hypothetical protein